MLLAVTGCGAQESSDPAAQAAKPSTEAGSSRIAVSYSGAPDFAVSGAMNYAEGTATITFGSGRFIATRDAVYVQLPADSSPSERTLWQKVVDDPSPPTEFLHPFGGSPTKLLELIRSASDIKELDAGTERGERVTRYRARVDVDRALQQVNEGDRASLGYAIKQYWPQEGNIELPATLSIDAAGRLRRIDVRVPGKQTLTIEFYDYGVDVDAKAPPPNQVVDDEGIEAQPND